jgi:hypothetical protein
VVGADHLQFDGLLGVELQRGFLAGLEQLVGDAGGQRGLRDVHDQLGHFGLARQLAQHLLQLLFHLRELLLQRLQIRGLALQFLEVVALADFVLLQTFERGALGPGHEVPHQEQDQQAERDAETELPFARPGAGVVEVEFLERHFLLHESAPPDGGCFCGAFSG